MAECYTELGIKNFNQNKFSKWFKKQTDLSVYYSTADNWDFYAEIEVGYGGYFWEAIAFMMINEFRGIAFKGCNQLIFNDHLISTSFMCDGNEVVLTRSLELPCDCDEDIDDELYEELDDMRMLWEIENDIPYLVKFSADEIIACSEIYKKAGKRLEKDSLIESFCNKHNIAKEKFIQFATILNFDKR